MLQQVATVSDHELVFLSLLNLCLAIREKVLGNAYQKAFSQALISSECDDKIVRYM